ncbi:MAG: hypothetical protein MUC50_16740 [Myxococcota bacterium]|jgi:hypothetical protein|nr:hypothetical protein [Myxococcota bacterium]
MKRASLIFACLLLPASSVLAETDSASPIAPQASASTPGPSDSEPGIPTSELPKIKLTVDPAEVFVGELVIWKLDIERSRDQRVHLPSSTSFGDLEIHSKDAVQGAESGSRVHESLTVRLIGFEAGERAIPPQKLAVVDERGRLGEVSVEPSVVKIKSLIANEPEPKLKEDKGPGVDVYQEDYTLLYVLIAILAALAVAGLTLLVRYLWNKRRPKAPPPPPPPRPAQDIAREKLVALQQSNLLDTGEIKQYHILLSEALREYLGNRYGFDSLEMSTEELMAIARRLSLSTEDFHELHGLLEDTDLVKFAKHLPALDTSRELLRRTFAFVERTTPTAAMPTTTPSPQGGPHVA